MRNKISAKSKELQVAIRSALAGGKILEKYFQTELYRGRKDDDSIVTKADTETEDVIKKIILKAFPRHSFFGEETGLTEGTSPYTWHIDPLDGTRNFSNGIPFFAVSIALQYKNEIIVAVVYNHSIDCLFYAEKGKGAFWNHKKMHVSGDNEKQCIVTASSGRRENDLKLRRNLMHDLPERVVSSVRDFGCTALDLSYIARGNLEATVQLGFKTYDFAAGTLLIQEAGGKITKLDGGKWQFPENNFIASNGVFHDLLVKEVQRQKTILKID